MGKCLNSSLQCTSKKGKGVTSFLLCQWPDVFVYETNSTLRRNEQVNSPPNCYKYFANHFGNRITQVTL